MVRVRDVGKMGVLSMEVLVEATGRCVREMRMRDQGLGGAGEKSHVEKKWSPQRGKETQDA